MSDFGINQFLVQKIPCNYFINFNGVLLRSATGMYKKLGMALEITTTQPCPYVNDDRRLIHGTAGHWFYIERMSRTCLRRAEPTRRMYGAWSVPGTLDVITYWLSRLPGKAGTDHWPAPGTCLLVTGPSWSSNCVRHYYALYRCQPMTYDHEWMS